MRTTVFCALFIFSALSARAATFNVSGTTLQLNLTTANETVAITAGASSYTFALTGGTWSGTDSADATGNGTASLSAVKASFAAVTVDDSSTGNGANFNDSGANTYTSSFTITLDSTTPGTSTFSGTTAFTGSNALSLQSGVVLGNSGSVVSTVDGNLTLLGNMQTPGQTGNLFGIFLNNTRVTVSGSGNLTIKGKSGISTSTVAGVKFFSGTVVTGGIAGTTVTVEGYGAASSTRNYGINLVNAGTVITSSGGNVVVTGVGGTGAAAENKGILMEADTAITATGSGSITVTGTGGGANSSLNAGVEMQTGAQIASVNGSVSVTGTGGGGATGTSNRGVSIGGSIKSTGSGSVSVAGTGGPGSGGDNQGVILERFGTGSVQEIKSGTGNVSVTGTAGGGSGSLGIKVNSVAGAPATISTGTGGSIALVADSMSLVTSAVISAPSVAIAPKTPGKNIDLGSASDTTANTLGLSQAELNTITATTLNLGDANTGRINVLSAITLPSGSTASFTAAFINTNGNTISGGTVTQTTTNVPIMTVEQPVGTALANGVTKDFGGLAVGSTADLVFTVKNSGSGDLTGLGITFDGANASEFSVFASPVVPVVPGGSTTFTIRHSATSVGNKTAAFHLNSNALATPIFDVNLTANSLPDINVEQPVGTPVGDGGTKSFAGIPVGSTADLVFTVSNPGNTPLTISGITFDGSNPSDFSVLVAPASSVPVAGSTTFTIRYAPTGVGLKLAALHIATNAIGAKSAYDINLTTTAFSTTPVSGTKSVGPTGDYTSLANAIADIQGATLGGALMLELQPAYVSTVETFPLAFTNLGTTATNTLTIRPQTGATNLSITSADTTAATIDLNGAQYVTFDGRPGGTGTAKQLTIENTNTAGVALRFINEASNNTIKFVTLQSVNTSVTSGTVVLSTTTGGFGNDNNTLDTCDIRDGATTPSVAIVSRGTTTTTAQANSGNTVTNCNIFNFYSASTLHCGVLLDTGSSDWTLSGNSFYQTTTRPAVAVARTVASILISGSGGNNFTITGNFIGGSAPSCGGTAWTTTGTTSAYSFQGMRLDVGTSTASSVQGNTIANIVWTTNSTASTLPGVWSGIYVAAGNVNVGTVTGNTIGSSTGTGSISVTTAGNGGTSFGIGSGSTGTVAIANNVIGSITTNGTSTSISASLTGISATAGTNTISNNTVGSTTTANSLNAATSSTSTTGQQVTGIAATSANITGNTVANLNNNYASTATAGQIRGIVTTSGVNTITGNTVRDLSTTSANPNNSASQSVFGIAQSSATAGQTVSQNTVHSLANTAASAAVSVSGIYFAGPTSGTNVIARNFIHSLAVSSTSTSSVLCGMYFGTGTFTVKNNLVRLGLDATGTSTAGASIIRSVYDIGTTAGRNFYHNSVYVGGTHTSSSTTYAFQSLGTTNTRDFRNNVFVNARSGTGKHCAVSYNNTGALAGMTASNNLFLASGTGGVLGLYNGDRTTLADWQTATGRDANSLNADPLFLNPTGDSTTVNLHLQAASPAFNTGLALAAVTDDIDGNTRNATTPTIGADEFFGSNIIVTETSTLTDGVSSIDFGTVTVGSSSIAKTFTLTNLGNVDLTTLAITKDGTNPSDFTVSALSGTSVPVGSSSVTFTVTFTPSTSGARSAAIHITSNVLGTKNPFDIALTGTGQTLFEAWAIANGTTANNSTLANFAFGTAPGVSTALVYNGTFAGGGAITATGTPITAFEPTTDGVDFRALFVRRKDHAAAGLTYTPRFSADLSTWQDNALAVTVLADDGVHQICSVPYPPFIGGKKARFFQVSVSVAP
ncbi:MAG: choice-of-anchor D domain-containing protein [Verrucomicrobiaceae bacterium]